MSESFSTEGPRGSGCLKTVLAGPLLVVLAPLVALVRVVGRARRGRNVLVRRVESPFEGPGGEESITLSLLLDVPADRDISRLVTDRVVRIAESLATGGES